jgi:hypothetical protein
MFAQSDADTVTRTLRAAGFTDPRVEPVKLALVLGADADEAVEYLADTGPGRAVLDAMPADRRPAALDAVRAALADQTGSDGVQLGAAIWIVTAGTPPPDPPSARRSLAIDRRPYEGSSSIDTAGAAPHRSDAEGERASSEGDGDNTEHGLEVGEGAGGAGRPEQTDDDGVAERATDREPTGEARGDPGSPRARAAGRRCGARGRDGAGEQAQRHEHDHLERAGRDLALEPGVSDDIGWDAEQSGGAERARHAEGRRSSPRWRSALSARHSS